MTGSPLADRRIQEAYDRLQTLSETVTKKYDRFQEAATPGCASPDQTLAKSMAYDLGRGTIRVRTYLIAVDDCLKATMSEAALIQHQRLLQGLQEGVDILRMSREMIEDRLGRETLTAFFARSVKNNDHAEITKICGLLSEAIAAQTNTINETLQRLPKADNVARPHLRLVK